MGQTVRVGGLVEAVADDGFRLDDGTAVAAVRLRSAATDLAGSVVVGDALSATGRVELEPTDGAAIIVVEDPAGIALVGGLGADGPVGASQGPGASPDPAGATGDGGTAGSGAESAVTAGLADLAVPQLGALGLVLISLASLAVTLLRRQRMRRRLAARIAERIASIVGSEGSAQPATGLADP